MTQEETAWEKGKEPSTGGGGGNPEAIATLALNPSGPPARQALHKVKKKGLIWSGRVGARKDRRQSPAQQRSECEEER